jgi:hypothetical protein
MKIEYSLPLEKAIDAHRDFISGEKAISNLKRYLLVVACIVWFLISYNENLGMSFSFSSGDKSFSTEDVLILRVIRAFVLSILFGWLTVKLLREIFWSQVKGRFRAIPFEAYGQCEAVFEDKGIVLKSPLSSQSLDWELVSEGRISGRYFHLKHISGPRLASIPIDSMKTDGQLGTLKELLK